MATKVTGQIAPRNTYTLGEYRFEVFTQDVPAENITTVWARCYKNGVLVGQKGKDFPLNTKLVKWHIEANDDTADIYTELYYNYGIVEPYYPSDLVPGATYGTAVLEVLYGSSSLLKTIWYNNYCVNASLTPVETRFHGFGWGMSYEARSEYTFAGKTVYWGHIGANFDYWNSFGTGQASARQTLTSQMLAWVMFYGSDSNEREELVARFAIDVADAGGCGVDSDWYDAGDYDFNREPDDPTTTLNLTLTGALSGRHNDPLHDTSYSYLPADKATIKDYGCGGDGGHGGGGGAGASTVIINRFATSRANSKELTTIARRHGYGSGGGKGGKGGDGCILIYY